MRPVRRLSGLERDAVTASPRETRPGPNGPVTLSARVWALLEDAYRAAGLDPARFLVVTQGSWSSGSLSGSTHQGGGAADLRTWNLPSAAQANLCRDLVVAIRERGGLSTWFRGPDHGGFAPHIHVIVRDEPALASGARWQVDEANAGRNGLSRGGPDYHPRPPWTPFTWPPAPTTPARRHTVIVIRQGSRFRLIAGDRAVGVSEADARAFAGAGVPTVSVSAEGFDALSRALSSEA